MEIDTRRLYLGQGCSSLFTYCTQILHLSEHAAYGRIAAARGARRVPVILPLLAEGAVTLTTVGLLAPHLTPDNCAGLLAAARHKSKRDVEHMIASLRPQPAVPSAIRKLPRRAPTPPSAADLLVDGPMQARASGPARAASGEVAAPAAATAHGRPARPPVIVPLAPERYKVQFTVTRETHDKLRRVQDLLRHTLPNGDPAVVFDRALTLLLASLERAKCAATDRPRAAPRPARRARHMPAAVKRAVWARDGAQCAFVGPHGRCRETGFLEFHHVVAYAAGGAATVENTGLRCRAHNLHEADVYFGPQRSRLKTEAANPYRVEAVDGSATRSGPSGRNAGTGGHDPRQPHVRTGDRPPVRICKGHSSAGSARRPRRLQFRRYASSASQCSAGSRRSTVTPCLIAEGGTKRGAALTCTRLTHSR